MASTDPWITYGRTRENTFATVSNPQAESYAAVAADGEIVGVVIVAMRVPLISGYVCGLAVKPSHRNRGIGTRSCGTPRRASSANRPTSSSA